jgi:fluoroacetyl-CoA thioesterase
MRDALAPGLENQSRHEVTRAMSAPHLPHVVLATPSMIGLIEGTCFGAIAAHLDDGETSVGTHVCVSHQAAATEGEEITIRCRLSRIDRRRLTFDVTVDTPRARISEGTHERAVIQLA